ncbi:insulin-like growth factor-binding protein complex acid labile subunit [Contarinia nasturtii]|uniref:insulin-like growth factor-binding protein complex acid labile subunit n=1 Tax=Contarinia nasturtii TaxID=265458 RepID=UPI0012D49216|nr:insulin-like growth factor-binding protein complex acid labile subunit [Contarinia nasturtii]
MGVHSSLANLLAILVVSTVGLQKPIGIQTCSDDIRQVCDCFYYPILSVRCSHKNLSEYPKLSAIQNVIERLDMSYNELTIFPPKLINYFALEVLDLSYNRIIFISQNVMLPNNLRHLKLSYNNISEWFNFMPKSFIKFASNLETLDLAGNPLGSFKDDQLWLISSSLKRIDLSNCQIHQIAGSSMLSGLINLEYLKLSSNPLHSLIDLKAKKLMSLDVSECTLAMLQPTVFSHMPALTYVNFSGNHHLSLETKGTSNENEYVESVSLRQIDLSNCNMNNVELRGFPNITWVNLNGNLITELLDDTFGNNILIEHLGLSSNAISRIPVHAFQRLKQLRSIDLSLNSIRQIEADTFAENNLLTSINLSRNYIDRFRRFTCDGLTFLNMSRCQIVEIDRDALENLHELIELDLSYNMFSELPNQFVAPFLQILDLKRCRLSHIDNQTFSNFPELSRLNLAGNRLTITLREEYFANNLYLNEIWLGDNPWRCDCDLRSHSFYEYIHDQPSRIKDPSQFRCYSPKNALGEMWEVACSAYWNERPRKMTSFERVWTIFIAILLAITIVYSVICGIKWWIQYRREARDEQQRQENLETTRELMRHNQIVLEQEGQLNAPDPRETHPPSYADAIRMPRLQASFISLKQTFASSDSMNSIRRATKRCRSEEFIGDDASNKNRRIILAARSRKNQIQNWIKRSGGDSNASISGFVKNNCVETGGQSQNSFEIITQLETEDGNSPYSKRKPQPESTAQIQSSLESLNEPIYANGYIAAEHSYYRSENSLTESEIPQTSKSHYISNETLYSTSSTSSFSSDEHYSNYYHQNSYSSKQSDV